MLRERHSGQDAGLANVCIFAVKTSDLLMKWKQHIMLALYAALVSFPSFLLPFFISLFFFFLSFFHFCFLLKISPRLPSAHVIYDKISVSRNI